jgi:hypothetical protein
MHSGLETSGARGYRLTKWGVEFSRGVTPAEFEELGRVLTRITNSMPWAVGDWLLAGEHLWDDDGKRYDLASAIMGQPRKRLAEYVRVSVSYRHADRAFAPWSYYRAALALPEAARVGALMVAHEQQWNFDQFLTHVRRTGATLRRGARARGDATAITRDVVECPKCGCRFGIEV